jgi:hypothetical protein
MGMAATTHPDEAAPVCPSLRLRRIEGLKIIFLVPQPSLRLQPERGWPSVASAG